jgi:hypothetical protein
VLVICPVGLLKFCTIRLGCKFMSCPRCTPERVFVACYEPTLSKIFCAVQNFMHTSTNTRFTAVRGGGVGCEAGRNYRCSGGPAGGAGPIYIIYGYVFLDSIIVCRL